MGAFSWGQLARAPRCTCHPSSRYRCLHSTGVIALSERRQKYFRTALTPVENPPCSVWSFRQGLTCTPARRVLKAQTRLGCPSLTVMRRYQICRVSYVLKRAHKSSTDKRDPPGSPLDTCTRSDRLRPEQAVLSSSSTSRAYAQSPGGRGESGGAEKYSIHSTVVQGKGNEQAVLPKAVPSHLVYKRYNAAYRAAFMARVA